MLAYRLLTLEDTSEFCHKVTKALSEGWQLYGDPQYAFDAASGKMRCAQAVVKESSETYTSDIKLSDL